MAVSKVYSLMRMRPDEVCWYKRHPVFDETEHVGWRNGTITEHTTFRFYDHPDTAPSNADFVDKDGNLMEYEDVLEAYDQAKLREKEDGFIEHSDAGSRQTQARRRSKALKARRPRAAKPKSAAKPQSKPKPEPVPEPESEMADAESPADGSIDPFGGQ